MPPARRVSIAERELYWDTTNGRGRTELLDALVNQARKSGWPGDFYGGWVPWDVELLADLWHHVTVRTVTEELGSPRRFTRARWAVRPTRVTRGVVGATGIWTAVALVTGQTWALSVGLICCVMLLGKLIQSRTRCLQAAGQLLGRAAEEAELVQHPAKETFVAEGTHVADVADSFKRPVIHPAGVPSPVVFAVPRVDVFVEADPSNA